MASSSPALSRRTNMDTSSIDLPDEIIELILSRCPSKSVGRFKSVSKSWQSIISDPQFCRMHHIQQSKLPENQNNFLIWVSREYESSQYSYSYKYESCLCDDESDYLLYLLLDPEDGIFLTESVMDDTSKDCSPLSSCDGLILLRNIYHKDYMLWNPLIRKHIIIPAFTRERHPEAFRNRPHNYAFYVSLHHLYFDSIADDYKILLSDKNCYTVYSCKNGIWGEIKDIPLDLQLRFPRVACVDGCIYGKHNGEIVCFDARDGKLHKFPQPNDVEGLELKVMSGRLCLYELSKDFRRLQLWVMEKNGSFEKSWRNLISMEKEEPYLWYLDPFCLTNEDDVVLCAIDIEGDFTVYKYNPRENCFQESDFALVVRYITDHFSYSGNLYMPSSNIC